ncbi:phage tail protein [Pseudomonas sp. WS 5406]|uniref:phage tail protein n=1 Tax=Pseudomonas sp. WS 5406 TaxID=2717498 RepID=UPI001472D0F8|nr:phage tail protein [Pseudomonas sp. WS 5406]NMX26599.1 phage tail protein [Pseudomonas sp. WS 5406]
MYAKWVKEDGRFAFSSADNGGVEITVERRQELIDGESNGQRIAPDKKGFPILIPLPPPSAETLAMLARQWRDTEIESIRWLRERHRDEVDSGRATTLSMNQSGELLDYAQALRDWPGSVRFPATDSRPPKPDWIIQQTQ